LPPFFLKRDLPPFFLKRDLLKRDLLKRDLLKRDLLSLFLKKKREKERKLIKKQ
jgi:hypothetical protein